MKWHPSEFWLTATAAMMMLVFQSAAAEIEKPLSETATKEFFIQKVQPLLQQKCFGCHGEDKDGIEGELDMSTREGLLKGGESAKPSLVPGQPEKSPMYLAILRQDDDFKMPPKDRNALSKDEIEIVRQWILSGAPWATAPTNGATKPKWSYKAEDIWAFQPVKKVSVPKIAKPKSQIKNPIDAFISEKLVEKNLQSAPRADKVTLIRRATFDLTGLPPTPKEIDDFVSDKSAEAFDKVIERLLASPRYGEQWARHWLDVVRYADTDGFSNDYERPNAWRYRDYVIRSFNSDKPYDQFVAEQIAGDEIDSNDPEKLIATGMLRMGPWEQTAMSVAAVTRQLFLDDVTASIGATYLGLTTGCAKCHDHKFDPIPTKDYYRLQSCFAPTQFESRKVDFLANENTKGFEKETERVKSGLKSNKEKLKVIRQKREAAVQEFLKEKGLKDLKDLPEKDRPQKDFGLTSVDLGEEKAIRKRIEYYEHELDRFQAKAFSVSSGGLEKKIKTPVINILVGGALESPGEAVTPGLLSVVYNSDDSKNPSDWNTIPQTDEGRRLKLAEWIASSENPLTARVMVNRIWQYHFGKGIVGTPNNFGKMGKRPTHPELLDWLADYFVGHKWSIKEMHRLIMKSEAYQQSATPVDAKLSKKNDPENNLYSHFIPRRLTAEELRDGILLVSGDLNFEMGGPGIFPEINLEAALQPRHIMGSTAPPYIPSPKREQRNRRTIYTFQIRSLINPMLEVFNAAPTENSCERRDQTTVTPQAFALFNSQNAHDAALAMAARSEKLSANHGKQIENIFTLAYGRIPNASEKQICRKHIEQLIEHHQKTKPVNFEFPKEVVRTMVEELSGEPFAFKEDWDMSNYEYNLRPSEASPETRALADLCLVILNSNEFVYVY
jgi:hypothetical protein